MLKKHVCVLLCFNNYEHIVESYNSLKNEFTDFIVIENRSPNTEKIKNFFISQNLKGYIIFHENITNNAGKIFIKNFIHILRQYQYITLSDCDLTIKDSNSAFKEIFHILSHSQVGICGIDLELDNLPNIPGSDLWIPEPLHVHEDYIECYTGAHLMTLTNENLYLIEDVHFLDSVLAQKVQSSGKKWVKTKLNKAKHLTWDLYYEGSEYYNFKINNKSLWNHDKISGYDIIVGEFI